MGDCPGGTASSTELDGGALGNFLPPLCCEHTIGHDEDVHFGPGETRQPNYISGTKSSPLVPLHFSHTPKPSGLYGYYTWANACSGRPATWQVLQPPFALNTDGSSALPSVNYFAPSTFSIWLLS